MTVEWHKSFSKDVITRAVNEVREVSSGKVTLPNLMSLVDITSIILTAVLFKRDVPDGIKEDVVHAVILDSKHISFTPASLIASIGEALRRKMAVSLKTFVVRGSMSIAGSVPFHSMKFGNEVFFFGRKASRYKQSYQNAEHLFHGDIPRDYLPVCVELQVRTCDEAAKTAIDSIDILRGIWNLSFVPQFRLSFEKRRQVSVICSGPLFTVHNQDGGPASSNVWWEPYYAFPARNYLFSEAEKKENRRATKRTLGKIQDSPISNYIHRALIMYVRAIDQWNLDAAFLQLWSLLEYLTVTGHNGYDATVRRAAIFVSNRMAREILEHLKIRRNNFIHKEVQYKSNQETRYGDIEVMVFQMLNFIHPMLRFYIYNKYDLQNIDDIKLFLDLSSRNEGLQQHHVISTKALEFQRNP